MTALGGLRVVVLMYFEVLGLNTPQLWEHQHRHMSMGLPACLCGQLRMLVRAETC